MYCVGFFFFKQKTAYEMRISDWSSDVCSSDLRGNGAPGNLHPGLQLAALRRRVRPPRPVPQLPRSLRTRVARRQLALGPARRDAAGPRAAARRHRMAKREDGATSFRLEHLAAANHVRIGDAHEALSDVRALIGMARLLKQTQTRLWEHAARLRH